MLLRPRRREEGAFAGAGRFPMHAANKTQPIESGNSRDKTVESGTCFGVDPVQEMQIYFLFFCVWESPNGTRSRNWTAIIREDCGVCTRSMPIVTQPWNLSYRKFML